MICSQFGVARARRASAGHGIQARTEHKVGAGGEKAARGFRDGKAAGDDAYLRNHRNETGLRPEGRGKENNFGRPCARKALINLDSAPEMEGNGKIWKGFSRRVCAKTPFKSAPGRALERKTASVLPQPSIDTEPSAARAAWESARPPPEATDAPRSGR